MIKKTQIPMYKHRSKQGKQSKLILYISDIISHFVKTFSHAFKETKKHNVSIMIQ